MSEKVLERSQMELSGHHNRCIMKCYIHIYIHKKYFNTLAPTTKDDDEIKAVFHFALIGVPYRNVLVSMRILNID